MPQGVSTFVEDGYATISVPDAAQRRQVLDKILKNTPPELVQTNTRTGPHRTYTIPEGNARKAGLVDGGEAPEGDRWDSGASAALSAAYEQEKADDKHIVTPSVAEHGYSAVSSRNPWGPEAAQGERNQLVTGPLRPNKAVDSSLPPVPPGAAPTAAALQARVKAARPRATPPEPVVAAKKAPARKAAKKAAR